MSRFRGERALASETEDDAGGDGKLLELDAWLAVPKASSLSIREATSGGASACVITMSMKSSATGPDGAYLESKD